MWGKNISRKPCRQSGLNHWIEQSYVAEASEASNDSKKRNLDGSEQSSKAGRKEQSYRQSRNVRQTKDNHGSSQDRHSPNDAPILLIGDSIIKNIDPWKMSRRKTVKICLPGKRAEQITAEVKSIPVINPSHVIHAGTNNLPTDSEYECIEHVEDLAKCTKARFPDAKVALSAITPRRDIDLSAKMVEVNNMIQELCTKLGLYFINNNNLNESCLNLNLNPKGSAYLATNFIKFIRGNNIRITTPSRRDADFQISAPQRLHLLEDLTRLMSMQGHKARGRKY